MSVSMPKALTNISSSVVLDVLRSTYKTVFIPAIDAGREIGLAEQTTRNLLSKGQFPILTLKIRGKRVVSIFVLADFVMQQSDIPQAAIQPPKVKRGAPTKSERMRVQGLFDEC